jgi:hypothetical protein
MVSTNTAKAMGIEADVDAARAGWPDAPTKN